MLTCPNCGSSDVRRLPLIYEAGVSQITTRTTGVGVTLGGAVGVGGARSKGISQTELAHRVAPPAKRSQRGATWAMVLGLIIGLPNLADNTGAAVIMLLVAAGGAWAFFRAAQWNRRVWPQLYDRWDRSYMCERCGHGFTPSYAA